MSAIRDALKKHDDDVTNRQASLEEARKRAQLMARDAQKYLDTEFEKFKTNQRVREDFLSKIRREGPNNENTWIYTRLLPGTQTNQNIYNQVKEHFDQLESKSLNDIEGFEGCEFYLENGYTNPDVPFHMLGFHIFTLGLLFPNRECTFIKIRMTS